MRRKIKTKKKEQNEEENHKAHEVEGEGKKRRFK